MGWVNFARQELQLGKNVTIKPHGGSMRGKINSGDKVILTPADPEDIRVGDIVLVKVKGNVFLHLVKAIQGIRLLIGNNVGKINGWTSPSSVYGIAIEIAGKPVRRKKS